jgi:hypothetical protein
MPYSRSTRSRIRGARGVPRLVRTRGCRPAWAVGRGGQTARYKRGRPPERTALSHSYRPGYLPGGQCGLPLPFAPRHCWSPGPGASASAFGADAANAQSAKRSASAFFPFIVSPPLMSRRTGDSDDRNAFSVRGSTGHWQQPTGAEEWSRPGRVAGPRPPTPAYDAVSPQVAASARLGPSRNSRLELRCLGSRESGTAPVTDRARPSACQVMETVGAERDGVIRKHAEGELRERVVRVELKACGRRSR